MENNKIREPQEGSKWMRLGAEMFLNTEKFLEFNREWELARTRILEAYREGR